MKPLHQVLQTARQRQHLTVSALHQRTTVSKHMIEALEAGKYDQLPPPSLVQGALQLLAEELELNPDSILALYRRDGLLVNQSVPNTAARRGLSWRQSLRFHLLSPRGLSWGVAGAIILASALGLGWQWWQLSQPPALTVTSPEQNAVLENPVKIQGQTQPENTVTLNTEVLALDPEGNFAVTQTLPPGDRTLVIEVTDQRGRSQQEIRFVRVTTP